MSIFCSTFSFDIFGEFDIDLTDSVAFRLVKKIENIRIKRIFFMLKHTLNHTPKEIKSRAITKLDAQNYEGNYEGC